MSLKDVPRVIFFHSKTQISSASQCLASKTRTPLESKLKSCSNILLCLFLDGSLASYTLHRDYNAAKKLSLLFSASAIPAKI
jgi:hypothetical protein